MLKFFGLKRKKMQIIQAKTLVSIFLKLEDEKGNLIDESEELMYLHGGYNQIFQKLEDELEGKKTGDTFEITLKPIEAFGEFKESLVNKEALEYLPDDIAVGMEFDDEDEENVWIVQSIEDGYAILNANHEFAGITLIASGKVLEMQHLSDEGVEEILNIEDEH